MNDLVVWQNHYEKYEVATEYLSLSTGAFSINSTLNTNVLFNDGNKGIDVFDVKFNTKVKTADKDDYLFAVFSGSLAAAFDQFVIGRTDLSKMKELDKKELFAFAKNVLAFSKYSDKAISEFEIKFEKALDDAEGKIKNAPKYKELANDFRKSLSIKGLFFSLFAALTGYVIGEDEKGELALTKDETLETLNDKSKFQKIELGFIWWLIKQAEEYNATGKFNEEVNDLIKGKQAFEKLKGIIKQLASTKLFKDKSIDKTEVYKTLFDKVSEDTKDLDLETEKYSVKQLFTKQMLPVLLNKCLVRSYLFVKLLLRELKERNVKSIDGLALLDISVNSKANGRVLARLDTVSSGVFLALDGAEALVYASKEATKAAAMAAALTPGDDKVKAAAAVKEGIKAGVFAYASSINVMNVFEFVAVVKADKDYLIEDAKKFLDKEIVAVQTAKMEAREKEKTLMFDVNKLTKVETKILYSLELDLIETDIRNTKDSETQVLKDEWKKKWIEISEQATDVKKLFYDDPEKVYAQLKTKAANEGDKSWLYRITLELMCFTPYTAIDADNPKKYSKLKLSKFSYLDSIFCEQQKFVSKKEINEMDKLFTKYFNSIGGSTGNKIKGLLGTVLITAAAAAAAFVFAPAIAVALVGNVAFAGLSGAALTSASLAFFGGGAIAAGGFGMAGGTMVIAGGGALLGLGASGMTLGSLIMLSSSAIIQNDYAKLLTTCDYILIKKFNRLQDVRLIQKQVKDSIKDYSVQLELIENTDSFEDKNIQKKLVKEMKKSLSVVEKADQCLDKLVNANVNKPKTKKEKN